jgi:hypothetical protein
MLVERLGWRTHEGTQVAIRESYAVRLGSALQMDHVRSGGLKHARCLWQERLGAGTELAVGDEGAAAADENAAVQMTGNEVDEHPQ